MIRQTLFTSPPAKTRRRKNDTEILRPTLGYHGGEFAQNLKPGFSPECRNVYGKDGFLRQRSGMSSFATTNLGGPILGAVETYDILGNLSGLIASDNSVFLLTTSTKEWSDLSYQASGFTASLDETLSGTSVDYVDGVCLYAPTLDKNIVVFSNNTNWLKSAVVEGSTTTYSDFTWAYSLNQAKTAKAVAAVNDRLVLANIEQEGGTRVPTRVQWSARGNPLSFLVADGGGAEDLASMRGEIVRMVRFQDFLLIFTEQEVWRANPTLDDYAFRFERISDRIGSPFPRTITSTPYGVLFLGADYDLYATDGVRVLPIGPVESSGPSRVQKKLRDSVKAAPRDRTFGLFNREERRYELYYPNDVTDEWCDNALFYNIDEQTFWPQTFSESFSFGFNRADVGVNETWDSLVSTWADMTFSWDELGRPDVDRKTELFTSVGSAYYQDSSLTLDNTSSVDARWRTHTFRQRNSMNQIALTEMWLDGEDISASTISFLYDASEVASAVSRMPHFEPVWSARSRYLEIRSEDLPPIAQMQVRVEDIGRF